MSDEREAVLEEVCLMLTAIQKRPEATAIDRSRLDAALDAALLAAWLEGHAGACVERSRTEHAAPDFGIEVHQCGPGWHCPEAQEHIDAAAAQAERRE